MSHYNATVISTKAIIEEACLLIIGLPSKYLSIARNETLSSLFFSLRFVTICKPPKLGSVFFNWNKIHRFPIVENFLLRIRYVSRTSATGISREYLNLRVREASTCRSFRAGEINQRCNEGKFDLKRLYT